MNKRFFSHFTVLLFFFILSCTNNPFIGIGNDKDVEYPKINIQTPLNSDYVGRYFNIKGIVSDDKGISRVEVSSPGFPTIVYPTGGVINIPVDAITLPDGPIKLTIAAFDTSGKRSGLDLSLTLDKVGPAISLFQPENIDSRKLVGKINFIGSASDDTGLNHLSSQNRFVIYKRGGSPDNTSDIIFIEHLTNSPFQVMDLFDTMSESHVAGLYTLRITYEDILGNIGERFWDIETIKGDDKTRLFIQSPVNNSAVGRLLTLSGYATNDFAAIDSVLFKIYKQSDPAQIIYTKTLDTDYAFSEILDLQTIGLTTARYVLYSIATDTNGNTSNEVSTVFDFDNTLPVFTIQDVSSDPAGITPSGSSIINGSFGITLQVVTPSPTAVQYKLMQNGVEKVGYSTATEIPAVSGMKYELVSIPDTLLADGSVTLYAKVTKGEKSLELNRIFYFDKTLPDIEILSHRENQSVNGSVSMSGSADDNLGLEKVEIKLPGSEEWITVTGTSLWSYVVADDTLIPVESIYNVVKPDVIDKVFTVKATDKAGNEKEQAITLKIDPGMDDPVVSILMPETDGNKVSGMLSVIGTIDDDDYPVKDMSAVMRLYKVSDNSLVSGYSITFDKTINGFPNIAGNINTEDLDDMTMYRIELSGSAWKNKTSDVQTRTFQVDKNTPVIEFDGDSSANESYLTSPICLKGKIRDKGQLAASESLMLSFVVRDGSTKSYPVSLTPSVAVGDYNVWVFNVTLNANGTHSGFVTPPLPADVSWGNDEYGNNSRTFTLRATDETALAGYNFVKVNLDNNIPEVNFTSPANGYVHRDTSNIDLSFSVDDVPVAGKEYSLNFNENIRIELYESGSLLSVIKDYNSGDNFSLTNANTYSMPQALAQSNAYQLRMFVKDNAGNVKLTPATLDFKKNSEPPLINSLTVPLLPYHKGTFSIDVIGEDRGSLADANGVDKIELFIRNSGGTVTKLYTGTYPGNSLTETLSYSFNSNGYPDGSYTLYAEVTDTLDTVVSGGDKNIYIDNTKPTVSITYQSMGETPSSDPYSITAFTAYLGMTVSVTDNASLMGDTPKIKVGTTFEGSEVLADTFVTPIMNGAAEYSAKYHNWIDLFEVLGGTYSATGTLHITVETKDAAGNIETSAFTINKGTLPVGLFTPAAESWFKPVSGKISIPGTTSGATRAFVKIGNTGETETVISSNAFTAVFNESDFEIDGRYLIKLRVTNNGDQNIVSRYFNIDKTAPVLTITGITAASATGNADGDRLSGLVTIKGTYTDNFADELTATTDAAIKLTIGSTSNFSPTRITRGYSGTPWQWEYDWNTEADSLVTRTGVSVSASAVDKAGNFVAVTKGTNVSVVPYITSIAATNGTDLVTEVRYHNGTLWGNHKSYKKYAVHSGKSININGFNLKQGTLVPGVTLGGTAIVLTGSTIHTLSTTGTTKSGDLVVTVNSIASDPVNINSWTFSLLGRSGTNRTDTLDAENYDMELSSTDKVIAVYARNHKVSTDYTAFDYSAFIFWEGQTTVASRFFGEIDPVFYASLARKDDSTIFATSTYDEWSGTAIFTKIVKINTLPNYDIYTAEASNKSFTNKRASMVHNGNGRLFVAYHDDDSREASPVPELTFISVEDTNPTGNVTRIDDDGFYRDLVSLNKIPVMVYYKNTNKTLNIAKGTSETATTFTINTLLSSNGGTYCKITPIGTTELHLIYQDTTSNLVYQRLSGTNLNTMSSAITLESGTTVINGVQEGITGFNTSIDLNSTGVPFISYMNNSRLETREALRFARSSAPAPTGQSQWEYMIVPSPKAVNDGNTIIKMDSNNNPVIMYKADNCLYIARLL